MFRKYEKDGYIICLGTGKEITEEEYNTILQKIINRPQVSEAYTCRLTSALEWEIEPKKINDNINELESKEDEL